MLKLNKTSYCHVQIRLACYKLEQSSKMKLETNLDENFDQIRFKKQLGYITIDYKNNAVFVLGHKITVAEHDIIENIMSYCNWLETMSNYQNKNSKRAKK